MRVLLTADTVGGVWTYCIDLARGLTAHGHAVTLALLGPAAGSAKQAEAQSVGATLVETGLPLDWLAERPEDVLAAGRRIAALARETGADLVHLNSPALAAGGAFSGPVAGVCHSCVATWWSAVRGGDLPVDFRWRTDLLARGYASCDLLAAPSSAFASATQAAYGLPSRPAVIHNGRAASPSPRRHAEERREAARLEARTTVARASRQASGPPQHDDVEGAEAGETPYALTAGRLWDEGKNLAALDRAAARTALSVMAAGPAEGPNGTRILLDHVTALGSLAPHDLAERLAVRPIFISLALYEPFGLAVLEAAQAGCALVLSDIQTFRELWDGAAIFVDPHDDQAAAVALDALASDEALRDRQSTLAQARSAEYSVERMIDATLALYAAALQRSPENALRAAS